MKTTIQIITAIALLVGASSCSTEGCTDPRATNYDAEATEFNGTCEYTIDHTYTFPNVSYSGQTTRIKLLDALVNKISEASNSNWVSATSLRDIYENNDELFGSTKNLSDKTYSADQSDFLNWFDELSLISSTGAGQEIDGRYYTMDGREIKQFVEKGLMGAVFYYQAMDYYLENINADDNTTVTEGKGTDMEHHFDEAFGYFGAPTDFGTNEETKGDFETTSWYWAKYALSRNGATDEKQAIFDAFLSARLAIKNKDNDTRDTQIALIRTLWEKLVAANVVHYINETVSDLSSGVVGDKYHHWSEGKAFTMCLQYYTRKAISSSDWNKVDHAFGNTPGEVTTASDFDEALSVLKATYGFTDTQMSTL